LPGEEVGVEQVPGSPRPDLGAGPLPRFDEPFGGEHARRLADRRAADLEAGDQLALARQRLARAQPAGQDLLADGMDQPAVSAAQPVAAIRRLGRRQLHRR